MASEVSSQVNSHLQTHMQAFISRLLICRDRLYVFQCCSKEGNSFVCQAVRVLPHEKTAVYQVISQLITLRHIGISLYSGYFSVNSDLECLLTPYYPCNLQQNREIYTEIKLWKVFYVLLSALKYAQSRGIYHGNVTPWNTYETETGEVKLDGWGQVYFTNMTSIQPDECKFLSPSRKLALFRSDMWNQYDPFKADIYSLGVTLLVLARGDVRGEVERGIDGLEYSANFKELLRAMTQREEQGQFDSVRLWNCMETPPTTWIQTQDWEDNQIQQYQPPIALEPIQQHNQILQQDWQGNQIQQYQPPIVLKPIQLLQLINQILKQASRPNLTVNNFLCAIQ